MKEEKAVAEDYRQQRQSANAQRNGFEYTTDRFDEWFAVNQPLLREIIKANGTAEADVEQVIQAYKSYLAATATGSKYDDKNARAIVGGILKDIEDLCLERKIPIRDGVVYGVAPEFGLLASQLHVFETEASIIEVSMPFVVFCNSVSKVLARSLPHEEGPMIKISNDPAAVRERMRASPELLAEWSRIISYTAVGWPRSGFSPMPGALRQMTRILLLRSMEWFALAHEYGHHVMKHSQTSSKACEYSLFADEHEADLFARSISLALGSQADPPNLYAQFGVGGVIVLGAMDLVRRARSVLETGVDAAPPDASHPPLVERVEVLSRLDQYLPEEMQICAKDMRRCFMSILDNVWEDVLPVIQSLHKEGLRPIDPAVEEGWLPR